MKEIPSSETETPTDAERLHLTIGEAIEAGDTETALALATELTEALKAELNSSEAESHESTVEKLVEKIENLAGVEISIFGTVRGLSVPLSFIMDGHGGSIPSPNQRDLELYERRRSENDPVAGLELYKEGDKKVIELIQETMDSGNRYGFKAIQVILPAEDEGLAEHLLENGDSLTDVMTSIWKHLEPSMTPEDKMYLAADE